MDHDDKMISGKNGGSGKVQMFLKDSLRAIRHDEQQVYNLESEFAKTRNNRNFFVAKVIGISVVAVVAVSWIVTSAINDSSRNVPVDIAVFEDLNLKNVLDMAKKAESRYDSVMQEKDTLDANYQGELSALRLQRESELEIVDVQRIGAAAKDRKKKEISRTYDAKERDLGARYKDASSALEPRLAEAKKQLEAFDKTRLEDSRAQKKSLDSQRDLFELEKKKMKESYESEIADLRKRVKSAQRDNARLKSDQVKEIVDSYQARIDELDPVLKDETAAAFVARAQALPADAISEGIAPFALVPPNIPSGFFQDASQYAAMGDDYRDFDYLMSNLARIPYENGAGGYADAARKMFLVSGYRSEKLVTESFNRVEKATAEAVSERQRRKEAETTTALVKERLSSYETMLTSAAQANALDGYVTGAESPESPVVFLLPEAAKAVLALDKPVVYVYRGKTLIATLDVRRDDAGIVASVQKLEKRKEILPMDSVLIRKK